MARAGFKGQRCSTCGCEPSGCVTATASFDDGTTDGWTTTGGVTEAGGVMLMPAGSAATFDTAASSVTSDVSVRATVENSDSDADLRVHICKTDANNYLFGQVLKAAVVRTIRLGRVVDGGESWLGEAVEVDDESTEFKVCLSWEPGPTIEPEAGFWLSTTITVNDAGVTWIDTADAVVPDCGPASWPFPGAGQSDPLAFQGLGDLDQIPEGSTIDGIQIAIGAGDNSTIESTIKVAALRLLDGTGTAVGDLYSDSNFTAFGECSFSTHDIGGETDDLNAGITTDDFTDLFGFFAVLENHDLNERLGLIDFSGMAIWYTTPERTPGRLRLAYMNLNDTPLACATNDDVENPAAGLKTGLHANDGDWEISAYSLGCTPCTCINCPTCSTGSPAAEQYTYDLGAGGWTDAGNCDGCPDVQGEYILNNADVCTWLYTNEISCGDDPVARERHILSLVPFGTGARWELCIDLVSPIGALPQRRWNARYTSPEFDPDTDCQTTATLTKQSEGAQDCPISFHPVPPPALCDGTLPTTLTLSVP